MNINSIYRPPGIDSFSAPLQPFRTGNKPRPDAPESEAFRVGQPTRPAPKPKFGNDAVNSNNQQWERPFKGLSLAIPRYNGNSVVPYGINVPPSQGGSGINVEEVPLGGEPTIQPIKQRPGELVGSYHLIGEPPTIQPIKPRPEEAVNGQAGEVVNPNTRPAPKPKFGGQETNNQHNQWERPFKGISLAIPRYNGNSVTPYGVNVPPSQGGSGIYTEEQTLGEQPTIQPIKQRPRELVGSYHQIGEPPTIQPIKPRPEEAVSNQIGTGGAHLGEPPSAGNGIYKVEVPLTAFQAYNNANGLGSTPLNLTPANLESSRTGNLSINRYITITA